MNHYTYPRTTAPRTISVTPILSAPSAPPTPEYIHYPVAYPITRKY